jgi:hypothetical protein
MNTKTDEQALVPINTQEILITDRGIDFKSFEGLWTVANMILKAKMAPEGLNTPHAIALVMARGRSVGLDPFQSMESMAVVNGRVMIWGDAPLAIARQHPAWDESGFQEMIVYEKNGGPIKEAVCVTRRKGGTARETHFSVEMATHAKLWGKVGPWTFYPHRMLMFRARGYALRDNFGDALKGLAIRETFDEDEVKPVESNGDQLRGEVEKRKKERNPDLKEQVENRKAVATVKKPGFSYNAEALKEHSREKVDSIKNAGVIQNAMNQSFPEGILTELEEARHWLCSVFEKIPIRMGAGTMLKDASLRDGNWISFENIENIDDVEYLKSIAANLEDALREVKV